MDRLERLKTANCAVVPEAAEAEWISEWFDTLTIFRELENWILDTGCWILVTNRRDKIAGCEFC